MNPAHFHLMSNHLPVVGMLFGLLLLSFALLRRSDLLAKTALGALVIVALLVVPAYVSGEPAEEWVERLPGVSERVIDPHEEAAKVALAATLLTGGVALVGLLVARGRPLSRGFAWLVLALALGAAGALGWTANLGGRIRHPEIRGDASRVVPDAGRAGG